MGPSVASKTMISSITHLHQVFHLAPCSGSSPSVIVANITLLRNRPFRLSREGPCSEEPAITGGRFGALTSCILEGLGVREGGVVGT